MDNIRSAHNVGSILRTADGLGVEKVILCGYTPYPKTIHDERLPYLADKINARIAKTALGAQLSQKWEHKGNIYNAIEQLKTEGYGIVALEQSNNTIDLSSFKPEGNLVLVVGNEIDGINEKVLKLCDSVVEIEMKGKKESLNVSVATAIALYYIQKHAIVN